MESTSQRLLWCSVNDWRYYCCKSFCHFAFALSREVVWLPETPGTAACQAPLSMVFPRQEYRRGLPFPFPGDPPGPRIEPLSPALESRFLSPEPPRKPLLKGILPSFPYCIFFFFYILLCSWDLGVLVESVCVCFLILWCMSILIPRNRKGINSN